ncbi:metal ABC transporter ATP-binding protein [Micrococcus sp.]|uniref:metal ABC transporter ATP-binding protein n=1 Tax=Micrococcus sp. TaxID=1271 RepID=UPI0026DB02E1|nr:metal ABC transporter ATP-binding protein [Micrococcus sp.]MDO4240705.1 metal ABC transporter ATP-binding protein [Micrococcus sp.]
MSAAPLIAWEGVDVDLAGRRILTGVDLAVRARELVGVVGPNGAGKTTLLRAALGLVPLSAGRVRWSGAVLDRRGPVGYVPQRHATAWELPMSVRDLVATGRRTRRRPGLPLRRGDHAAIDAALARADVAHLAERPVADLSGGQRQRALIARALSREPRVLLLDEPYTGVDAPTQLALDGLLRGLAEEGVGVVMTTHDLRALLRVATRLVVVDGGVRVDAEPDTALTHPAVHAVFGLHPDLLPAPAGDAPIRTIPREDARAAL